MFPDNLPEDDFSDIDAMVARENVRAKARKYGLIVSSGQRSPARNAAVGGAPQSAHLTGDAEDYVGAPGNMRAFARDVAANDAGNLSELYHGAIAIKNGRRVRGIGGHQTHVHVAWPRMPQPQNPKGDLGAQGSDDYSDIDELVRRLNGTGAADDHGGAGDLEQRRPAGSSFDPTNGMDDAVLRRPAGSSFDPTNGTDDAVLRRPAGNSFNPFSDIDDLVLRYQSGGGIPAAVPAGMKVANSSPVQTAPAQSSPRRPAASKAPVPTGRSRSAQAELQKDIQDFSDLIAAGGGREAARDRAWQLKTKWRDQIEAGIGTGDWAYVKPAPLRATKPAATGRPAGGMPPGLAEDLAGFRRVIENGGGQEGALAEARRLKRKWGDQIEAGMGTGGWPYVKPGPQSPSAVPVLPMRVGRGPLVSTPAGPRYSMEPISSAEEQLANEFEDYKSRGDLIRARQTADYLHRVYGWEYGFTKLGDVYGTEWPYIKPPTGQDTSASKTFTTSGKEFKSYGPEAFLAREEADRKRKSEQEEFRRTDQRGVLRRAGEGALAGLKTTVGDVLAGGGRLAEDISDLPREARAKWNALTTSKEEADRLAAAEQPSISAVEPGPGGRLQRVGEDMAESGREHMAIRGQDWASQTGGALGQTAPYMIPGWGEAGVGLMSGLSAYGQGRSLPESILTGVTTGGSMRAGRKLGEALASQVSRPLTQNLLRLTGNLAAPTAMNAGVNQHLPDTPQEVASAFLTALGWTGLGRLGARGAARGKGIGPRSPETPQRPGESTPAQESFPRIPVQPEASTPAQESFPRIPAQPEASTPVRESGTQTRQPGPVDRVGQPEAPSPVEAEAAWQRVQNRAHVERGSGGPSTEELQDWLRLASYHVEAGAREFGDFSRRLTEEIGEPVKPYLAALYLRVASPPGSEPPIEDLLRPQTFGSGRPGPIGEAPGRALDASPGQSGEEIFGAEAPAEPTWDRDLTNVKFKQAVKINNRDYEKLTLEPEETGVLYVLKDAKTGEMLKVGKTEAKKLADRFRHYRQAARREGRDVVADLYTLPKPAAGTLEPFENRLRWYFELQGEPLLWDQQDRFRTRLGRPGPGVPGTPPRRKLRSQGYRWDGSKLIKEPE